MSAQSKPNRFVVLFAMFALIFSFMGPLSQPAEAQTAPADYCSWDSSKINGGVVPYLTAGAAVGGDVDYLDVYFIEQYSCYLNMGLTSQIVFEGSPELVYRLRWVEGTTIVGNPNPWRSFPAIFDNGYSEGSVDVTVFIVGREEDYYFWANEDPYPYPYPRLTTHPLGAQYSRGGGEIWTVDTNCLPEPEVVYGCSQGFYKNNAALYTELNRPLGEVGFITDVKPGTTLLEVISNPKKYDGYTRQQVTAYLNSVYEDGYALDTATILAGGYDQATLEWNNHGAYCEGYIGDCPLD